MGFAFLVGNIELSARNISIKDFLKVVEFNENWFCKSSIEEN